MVLGDFELAINYFCMWF